MNNWFAMVYKAFILASIIAFIIGAFVTGQQTSLGAYIAGYAALSLGIMMVLVVLFSQSMQVGLSVPAMIAAAGPFVLLFGVIGFMLFLTVKYKSAIADGHVAAGYHTFSNITILLLMLQLYIVYKAEKNGTGPNKITTYLLYLIGIFSSISALTTYTILKYYSTDGFAQYSY